MLFVDNAGTTDPKVNLAIEEHLLRNVAVDEPMLLLYVNAPSVIIGRNQNVVEEIDPFFVREQGIQIVRRLSGGGAVYHDLGNLNFSFIVPGQRDLHNYARFLDPVIGVLRELGLQAELRDKSAIYANGKKVSGNAQFSARQRMLSHGTLLFRANLDNLRRAIRPRPLTVHSRAVQSRRAHVANIYDLLPRKMEMAAFRHHLLTGLFGGAKIEQYTLTADDWAQVQALVASRYSQWDWNVGRSPKFEVVRQEETAVGPIYVRITVDKGHIQAIQLQASALADVAALENALVGCRYEPQALTAVLVQASTHLPPSLPPEALFAILY
ncbi:MAG: lipoate protein ligase LplA1 [Candidatus Promineifilaceae bacterium]